MAYVESGARIGRDNRAAGSPAGKENLVNQTYSPAPLRPMETGLYAAPVTITSITRSGTTATISATSHGLVVGSRFRIIGADQKAYNHEFRVLTRADANTVTCTVHGSPTSPATGTMTLRKIRQVIGD